MDKTKEQLEKLREVAEASLTKTDELQKVLAQIEALMLSLIHISEPTRQHHISYAVFCLKEIYKVIN